MKVILIILLIAGLTGCSDQPSKIITGLEGKPLPAFNVLLMDSTTLLKIGDIRPGKPTVIFLFNPYCPYCKAQTEELVKNIKDLSGVRFYLISSYPFAQVKNFFSHYGLEKFPSVIVGQDYSGFSEVYYKAAAVPYIAIYDKDKRLKEVFVGRVDPYVIKKSAL